MDRPEISCPYVAGNSIPMQLKTPDGVKEVEARIIRVFEPFTLSCAMVVRVDCPDAALDGNEDMVLKVFDRRFSTQARDDEKMPPWSLEIEKAYNEFRQSELGLKFVAALEDCTEDPPRDQASKLWNSSHNEAYTQWYLNDLFERELQTYETLKDWQGNNIPRLIATVHVPGGDPAMPQPDMEGFSGVLLEFIPGFFLTDIADNAPQDLWQPICDHAIRIVNLMGDRGILNEDVQTRSFIISIDGEDRPKGRPEGRSEERLEDTSEEHPEKRPEERPEDTSKERPEDHPGFRSEDCSGVRSEDGSEVCSEDRSEERPEDCSGVCSEDGAKGRPEGRSEDGSEERREDHPGVYSEDRSEECPEHTSKERPQEHPDERRGDCPEDCPEDISEGILGYKITMIDFAYCAFREDFDDEQEWSEAKGVEEEEERIGLPMESKLKGGFVYNRSFRWKKPASYYEGGEGFE